MFWRQCVDDLRARGTEDCLPGKLLLGETAGGPLFWRQRNRRAEAWLNLESLPAEIRTVWTFCRFFVDNTSTVIYFVL